jgi:His-Xaa-Ser system protein HxsD
VSGAAAEGFKSEVDSDLSATIYLDPRIYSREAILKACYWLTNVAYVQIPESPDGRIVIQVRLKQTVLTLEEPQLARIEDFIGDFCNSLLDFELRRQVETETASLKQLILAKAFSESGVLEAEPPGTIADPVENRKPTSLVQIMKTFASPKE